MMASQTSRTDAVIAWLAAALVLAASLYFVNPAYAAQVDTLLAPALAMLP